MMAPNKTRLMDQDETNLTDPTEAPVEAGEAPSEDPAQALRAERDDLYERLLRTTADFDNYRKRIERERREVSEAATADLIRDLLPVVDDLERALANSAGEGTGEADPDSSLRRGIELIHRFLLEVLRRRGVEPFDAVGQPFDPAWHEAISHETGSNRPEGEIIGEVRRGYRLGARLLRPSQVRVAKA
jgi:molecular chaperone GrpE